MRIALLAALVSLAADCSGQAGASPYREIDVVGGGSVRGRVRLTGRRPQPLILEVSQDTEVCGDTAGALRLSVGRGNGVQNALVYLRGVTRGKQLPLNRNVVIEQQRCQYSPRVAALTLGAEIEIVNRDPILHSVHGREMGARPRTTFNIAQPVMGQRTRIRKAMLAKEHLLRLSCDAGHPWMSGYIVVTPHPYVAVTGEDGSFVLEEVPPGAYDITMWHEGVALVRVNAVLQLYQFEAPYEISQRIQVPPGRPVTVKFELRLRDNLEKR